jgi:hypothetical protein
MAEQFLADTNSHCYHDLKKKKVTGRVLHLFVTRIIYKTDPVD